MLRRSLLLSALAGFVPTAWLRADEPRAPVTLHVARASLRRDPVADVLALPPEALPGPAAADRPIIEPEDRSAEASLLRRLQARGRAAGLSGTLYDNRDRGHSAIPPGRFSQMTRIAYDPDMAAEGLDYGLAGALRFPAITLGNSSTAITHGTTWRSLPRLAMTAAGGPARAAADYAANALYVYPEHRDHDADDLFPAAWPYMTTSQGSSGSDQPFLRALGMILASFPPETRARMESLGLVAPTAQMVLRRTQMGLLRPEAYLSGAAHPSAFAEAALHPEAQVALAASLAPDALPPAVDLRVVEETFLPRAGLLGTSERLFDTPGAIARLWLDLAGRREMLVSTEGTLDPAGRALVMRWVLLRGDPSAVTITPLDAAGRRARISLGWQEPRPAPAGFGTSGAGPMSSRVDVGVFAEVGGMLSAPAFVSVTLPPQTRAYQAGPDGAPQLREIDYDAGGRPHDPVLFWRAGWRDRFHHDAAGRLLGWTRESIAPDDPNFAAAGDYAPDGTRGGQPVRYALRPSPGGRGPELIVQP